MLQLCRHRFGQKVLRPDVEPSELMVVLSGVMRSLAVLPGAMDFRTIDRFGSCDLVGWPGLIRGQPCEHLRASSELELPLLPAEAFLALLTRRQPFAASFKNQLSEAVLHQLLEALAPAEPVALALLQHWPPPL